MKKFFANKSLFYLSPLHDQFDIKELHFIYDYKKSFLGLWTTVENERSWRIYKALCLKKIKEKTCIFYLIYNSKKELAGFIQLIIPDNFETSVDCFLSSRTELEKKGLINKHLWVALIAFKKEYQKKGIAKAAFQEASKSFSDFQIKKIIAFIHKDNLFSQSFFKKMGFSLIHEGNFFVLKANKYYDYVLYLKEIQG